MMNWTVALYNTKTFKILYVNREVHIQNFPQNTNLQLLVFHVVQYMCMLLSCSVWALVVSFPVFYSSLPLVYMCFGVLTFSVLNFTVAVMVRVTSFLNIMSTICALALKLSPSLYLFSLWYWNRKNCGDKCL